jgi:hypothetical protein
MRPFDQEHDKKLGEGWKTVSRPMRVPTNDYVLECFRNLREAVGEENVTMFNPHNIIKGWLSRVAELSAMSGTPDEDFFYLAGPMSGVPQFNFPEFDRVAGVLRDGGYNIVSPAELDDPADRRDALSSAHGDHQDVKGKQWSDFLARDVVICAMPTCRGAVLLPGWEKSKGAQLETFVLDRLGKPLFLFHEPSRSFTALDRDEALNAYNTGGTTS